jgi:polysaccharide deacetylase family protein (PEP-CTERM system associated)
MLSFDVEEYFQVEAARELGIQPDDWDGYASRLEPVVDRILGLLAEHADTRATFFILGWVARRHGDLVRRIAQAGHEIASHGMTHTMLDRLGPDGFRAELDDSRAVLEDLSGQAVQGFRAPTFSVMHRTAWAIDVLEQAGYGYDSSVFPVSHDRYGVPEAPTGPHTAVGPGGGRVLEIPPMTMPCCGKNLPVGGGGYLRLLPIGLIGHCLRGLQKRDRSGMIYLHPWELDGDQPTLPGMTGLAQWRHRVGLRRAASKLAWLLKRFRFGSVAEQLDRLKAEATQEFVYGTPAD